MRKARHLEAKNGEHLKRILETSARLFRERGYDGVTVDDIAESLGVSKLGIYYYIESKSDIYFQIHYLAHKTVVKGLRSIVRSRESPEEKLRRAITNHINVVCSDLVPTTEILWQAHMLPPAKRRQIVRMREQYDQMLRGIISEGISKGDFIPCDVNTLTFFIEGAINYMPHWYRKDGRLSKSQLADICANYFVRGLLASEKDRKASECAVQTSAE